MNATPDSTFTSPEELIADLRRRLAEAREQQAATAEILEVINSSPGDLAPVFHAILEKATRLCDAAFGLMATYSGGKYHVVATHGVSPDLIEFLHAPPHPDPESALGRIEGGEDLILFDDIADTDLYRKGDPRLRALVDLGGAHSFAAVALRKDRILLGIIAAYRGHVRPFEPNRVELLRSFAAQAVIAMENARLLDELRQRTGDLARSVDELTATSDVLKIISQSAVELKTVLDTLVGAAARLCRADQVQMMRHQGDRYHVAASHGASPEFEEWLSRNPLPTSGRGTATARAATERRTIHIADVLTDPQYTWQEGARVGGYRTILAVPLLRGDTLIGLFALLRTRVAPFTNKEIELATTFADQAVIAIENARLLDELRQRTDQVAELNRGLEARLAEQVEELGRVGRLKRFLAPQLAELIVSQGNEKILESHRREIVVVFCDLRGYTAFTETAEPEEVLDFLRDYHGALGPLVAQFEGTLDQFSGDGIMVFFNDPVPIPDPAERAVRMAMAMREEAGKLIADWRARGRDLGFGAGIAQGYATLGQIGFSERSGYTAIGTVCNVAARLCAEAKDGQILLGQRVNVALKGSVATEQVGAVALKGLTQPVVAYNVPIAGTQLALRVIEGGPQSV